MNKKYESMSMVEVAVELQLGAKELTFQELYQKVCKALEFTEEEQRAHIAQFYTDVTASGDFVYCGNDKWDLKKNQKLSALDSEFYQEHLVDEAEGEEEEEETQAPKTRRRTKKAKTLVQDEEGSIKEVDDLDDEESEDQSYENIGDEYEIDESEEYDTYEKDFDSSIDDDYEDEEDDEDEDKYNEIMDNFEDLYDN